MVSRQGYPTTWQPDVGGRVASFFQTIQFHFAAMVGV
jgi:hypothetical protein